MEEIKLTSPFTKVGIVIGFLLVIAMIPVFIFVGANQQFHFGMLIAPIMLAVLIGLVLNLVLFNSDAKIVDQKLVLKKMFRPEVRVEFSDIENITSHRFKSTKYTKVKVKTENKSEKFLLMNKLSSLSVSNIDSEAILRSHWLH